MLCAVAFVLSLGATAAGQTVTLESLPSGMEIEIQDQADHYRVHMQVRFQNATGTTMFISLKTVPLMGGTTSTDLREIEVSADDEVWDCYLRAPLHSRMKCDYTLTAGESQSQDRGAQRPLTGFKWSVERDANRLATIVDNVDGKPLPIEYSVSKNVVDIIGGSSVIKPVEETKTVPPKAFRLGKVEGTPAVEFGLQRIK
jgi:hypothetical protein